MSNAIARAELKTHAPGIRKVPEEILRAIFTIVVETLNILWDAHLHYMYDHRSPAHGSLALSHVCAAWRTTTRNYGQLWCAIDLVEPELAELCLNLSKTHNIHVFCRTAQKTLDEEPKPRYIAALERVFKESVRIETLRLSDYYRDASLYYRPHYQQVILPIVTRLDAKFPNLKTLRGTMQDSVDLSLLVKGASASLRELDLSSCDLSLDVFFSLQSVVELKIGIYLDFELDDWRRIFGQLAPTLRHLVMMGGDMPHMNPPVTLPILETLHIRGEYGLRTWPGLHAPQATQITIEDEDGYNDEEQDLVGDHCSVAINQRLPDITALRDSFRLIYSHEQSITLSNSDIEFVFKLASSVRMLSSLCLGLYPALCHTITYLELSSAMRYSPFIWEENLSHWCEYQEISESLSGLEEICMHADTAADLLLWLSCPEKHTAFSTVKSIKISHCGYQQDPKGRQSVVPGLVEMQNMRMESGHPIQLTLVAPGEISQETLDLLRKGGHAVLVDDDVDVRPYAQV
jgi:hypothetical protein